MARNAVYPEGHQRHMLLQISDIRVQTNLDVSTTAPEERGMLYAVLRCQAREVHAVCVHLWFA